MVLYLGFSNDVLWNSKFRYEYLYYYYSTSRISGSGYNEYNKIENLVKIVRKGFPGKNREILLTYPLSNIEQLDKNTEVLNPTQVYIYV
jgi:hypothetical protein